MLVSEYVCIIKKNVNASVLKYREHIMNWVFHFFPLEKNNSQVNILKIAHGTSWTLELLAVMRLPLQ